ncbi:MAG: thioredoxin domain-containing protein [Chloroflexota bacterium]
MARRNRNNTRRRRQEREQEKQRQQIVRIIAVVIGVFVLGIVGFFVLGTGNSGPEQPQARLDLDPILGNPDAPVTLIEYGAYGCEACRSWHEAGIVEDILATYPNQVRFIYRDLPIISAAWSQEMAEVAQCALDQSNDLFWQAHNTLFEDTELTRTSQPNAVNLVLENAPTMDETAFRDCVNGNTHFRTVRFDMERLEVRGVRGTPTWFVNGQQVYSASPQVITQLIDNALTQ